MKTTIKLIAYTYREITTTIKYAENDILFVGPGIILTPYMIDLARSNNTVIYRVENNPDRFMLVGETHA